MFRNHRSSQIAGVLIGAALLAACSVLGGGGTPTPFPDWAYTQAAQTIVAEITQNTPPLIQTAALPTWTDIPLPTPTVPPSPTLEPSPTLTPSSTATSLPSATPNMGTLVYSDDFSEDSGWNTETTDSWSMGYANGGYYIVVNITNAPIWSVRNQELSDVRLEVDAVQTAGSDSGYFGLVCRHLSGEDYYTFAIGGDGFYGIGLVEDGEKLRWLQEGAAPAGLIQPAGAVNRIQADCIGSTLALYANGQKLAEVSDETFDAGDTGLLAATRKESGTAVLFSNYAIYVP
jgi:hypothetical protein